MRQTFSLILLVMGFVALASGCAHGSPSTSQTIESGGVTRDYLLYQPANLPSGEVPLVIGLHGAGPGGGAQPFENGNGFDQLADQDGFVVAYPEALGSTPTEGAVWHMGCCDATQESSDDVEFIEALIGHLVATDNVDPRQVYVVGFSVGAAMAYRVGCESNKVAGVGSVGGWERLSVACHPSHPVSVYEIHGTADSYDGKCGEHTTSDEACYPGGFGTLGYSPSVRHVNEQWRAADNCPATPPTTQTPVPGVTRETWGPCGGGSAIRLDTIQNGGHCWPTQTTCGNYGGSAALWAFLSAHPLPFRPGEEPPDEEEELPPDEEEELPPDEEVPPKEELPPPGGGGPPDPVAVTPDSATACTVPNLRGRHLDDARRVARHAGCRIGHVHRTGDASGANTASALIVRWQSLRSGTVRDAETRVAVMVGPMHRHR